MLVEVLPDRKTWMKETLENFNIEIFALDLVSFRFYFISFDVDCY